MERTTLKGLMPDTEYFIRMQSTNKYGTGERKSNELNIKTKIPPGKADFVLQRRLYMYFRRRALLTMSAG